MRLGPPAAVSFPARFHYRDGCESVQISTPVVPEQRSGGRQPPRTCCLFTATSSAHKTGKSQDVCARRERCRTGQAGWTGERERERAAVAAGLAKEVKLTSLKIFRSCLFFTLRFTERWGTRWVMICTPNPVSCGCFNPQWDGELWQRQCRVFFFFFWSSCWSPSTPHWRCPAVYCNQPSDTLPCFHISRLSLRVLQLCRHIYIYFFSSSQRCSDLLCVNLNAIPLKVLVYFCSRCSGLVWLPTLRGWVSLFLCCCVKDVWCEQLFRLQLREGLVGWLVGWFPSCLMLVHGVCVCEPQRLCGAAAETQNNECLPTAWEENYSCACVCV